MSTPHESLAIDAIISLLRSELCKAVAKHGPMASPHEGWAIIKEELDELWEHVKHDTGRSDEAMKEALQIAAMGIRYVVDFRSKDLGSPMDYWASDLNSSYRNP